MQAVCRATVRVQHVVNVLIQPKAVPIMAVKLVRLRPVMTESGVRFRDVTGFRVMQMQTVAVIVSIVVLVKSMGSGSQSAVPAVSQSYNSADLLKIVSARYPLEKTEVPELSDFQGYKVNSIMLSDIKKMFDAAKDKGISLKIKSAYISYDEQEKLFEKKLKEVNRDGKFSQVRASAMASADVSRAGESEAQLGMLVDFDISNSKAKAFLEREGIEYGFILRFPDTKEDLTHHNYSASVFRYVGSEYAGKMRTLNMCLEEFSDYQAEK